jgi:hypothetical protein
VNSFNGRARINTNNLIQLARKDKMMRYGILNEKESRKLFEDINGRTYCVDCQKERSRFSNKEKKNNRYSNLFPGFSSEKVSIPIDILIVATAHGGGREETFRPQNNLATEVAELGDYYLTHRPQKFHQIEMRKLFNILKEKSKIWIFTDLIKCFVWQGRDESEKLKGSENTKMAIGYCRKYLDNQIVLLKPKKIISLGNIVTGQYFKLRGEFSHGSVHKLSIDAHSFELIFSIFPSRNTADLWTEHGGWDEIVSKI